MPSPTIVKVDQEVEVWTERQPDGRVEWSIRVDGEDHGGGTAASQWQAFQQAADYMRDRANAAFEAAETARETARRAKA